MCIRDSRQVERLLTDNEAHGRAPRLMDLDEALRAERIVKFDPAWAYYEHLGTLCLLYTSRCV